MFDAAKYRLEFNIILQGLLHRVPVLDRVIGVVLGYLLYEKSGIKLSGIEKIYEPYLGASRAFLVCYNRINFVLFMLSVKLTTRYKISHLCKFFIEQ